MCLGTGASVFAAARDALAQWKQFDLGWVEAWPIERPPEAGQLVCILGRAASLWWLNACRVIDVFDESTPEYTRYGFAYGTLPSHAAQGEERFAVEWLRDSGQVFFEVRAFSRPGHWWARLGYPLMRRCQERFGRESAALMFRAVNSPAGPLPVIHQSAARSDSSTSVSGCSEHPDRR
jgi:uncharacterized protein (UPF0548 family)